MIMPPWVIPLLRAALEPSVTAAGLNIAPRDGSAMATLRRLLDSN
jgi:hypothetical protein